MDIRGDHRVGFININDMYNNDVGKKSAQKFMKQTGDLRLHSRGAL